MNDTYSPALFAECLGETFNLCLSSEQTIPLELIEATTNPLPRRDGRASFSLLFRGPVTCHLPQHIYSLKHERLGTLDLFLVPIGPDETGMCFEAIFN